MAYLGKTPSQATRARYYYTATGGETSLSGADDNGNTLVFSDGNYVDVMLNGVTLVAGTDYDTDTANTIDNLSALTASDVVEIVVYDTFSVFGGNVNGDFNIQNGTLTAEAITGSGDMNIDSGTLFVDASENRVGIGTTSPNSNLSLGDSTVDSDNVITFGKRVTSAEASLPLIGHTSTNGTASDLGICATSSSGKIVFYTGGGAAGFGSGSNAERVRITSAGLSFDGGSNHLGDYEEGLYTITLTPSTSGTITANTTLDRLAYTKIGRQVTIVGQIDVSSVSNPVGDYVEMTLPFQIGEFFDIAERAGGAQSCLPSIGSDIVAIGCLGIGGTSVVRLYIDASTVQAGADFFIQYTYFVD